MIRSMTAYARREVKGSWGTACWELRSVNQRYLETTVRLPETFRHLENSVRERLRQQLTRGKVECYLRVDRQLAENQQLSLNEPLAEQLISAARWIKSHCYEGEIQPVDIMHWPGVLVVQEEDLDAVSEKLLRCLDKTIDDFIESRATEGQALKVLLEQRLVAASKEVRKIRKQMPEIIQWQRDKLTDKLAQAQLVVELDQQRLEQELIILAQRLDIAEELDRLTTHIDETHNILKRKEAVGRRLDFMMQEFNRETNTIASKSINADITSSAIELKVLIEQMREQIQNIE